MEKIFTSVAVFAVALMAATAGLGLWLGDLHGQTDQAILRWGTVHRLSGVLAALVVVLVNSMSVTYFIGTGAVVPRGCGDIPAVGQFYFEKQGDKKTFVSVCFTWHA
jgi:hypothetical protein